MLRIGASNLYIFLYFCIFFPCKNNNLVFLFLKLNHLFDEWDIYDVVLGLKCAAWKIIRKTYKGKGEINILYKCTYFVRVRNKKLSSYPDCAKIAKFWINFMSSSDPFWWLMIPKEHVNKPCLLFVTLTYV